MILSKDLYFDRNGTIRQKPKPPTDDREPDYTREGIFIYHNCSYCDSGKKPCREGNPNRCENPMARND